MVEPSVCKLRKQDIISVQVEVGLDIMLLQDQLIHHFLSSMSCWTHVNTRERRHLASFDPYPCSYGVLATLTCQAMVKRLSFALEKSTGTVDFSNALVKRLSSAFNWRGWFLQCFGKTPFFCIQRLIFPMPIPVPIYSIWQCMFFTESFVQMQIYHHQDMGDTQSWEHEMCVQ